MTVVINRPERWQLELLHGVGTEAESLSMALAAGLCYNYTRYHC